MENKTMNQPSQPNNPKLLELHNTKLIVFIYRSRYFIILSILYYYWMYVENDFASIYIYYTVVGIYVLSYISHLVQNISLRKQNKKILESYHKQIIDYNKKLEEFIKYDKEKNGINSRYHPWYISDYDAMKTEEYFERVEKQRKKNLIPQQSYKSKNLIENKPFVNNSSEIEIKSKINEVIRNYSGICAVLAIQPIPFADIFILTPTQILMGKKIASLRGYEIKENTIESILKEISGIIGMGIIAQQLVIGSYKTFLPFLGGVTTIPAVYGLTYGIGKTMDYYIVAKINGKPINKGEIENIFRSSREIGQQEGKSKEKEIQEKAKK